MNRTKILSVVAILFATSLGVSYIHPFGNPHAVTQQPREALLQDAAMPDAAKRVLINKCADCHSQATHWPVYSHLAPMSWLVERDIVVGRQHLNLTHWKELPSDKQEVLSAEIVQQAKKRSMPLPQYLLLHWDARLSESDVAALSSLTAGGATDVGGTHTGDAAQGKSLFERRCTGCHALDSDREGPHLRGAFGRKAGSVPGFSYSPALKNSGVNWNEATLERWLQDSDAMVPNSAMGFSVPKAQNRADLIAFLKSVK
ncbi:heme-binding domain-containing protein [Acidicapsa ligni]|uniref:heme-binding domain-containing protein n=1 Tax=Acidicapsa ligni TaxID=542300 RepID=UPI0021E04F74|nr:heme-binding domain-containing protein [Acidicapsa ligni]